MTRVSLFIDDDDKGFEAAYIDPRRWNGFACPAFTLEVVREIAAATDDWAVSFGLENTDMVSVDAEGKVWITDADGRNEITPNEKGLYAVGAWGWTWMEINS